MRIANLAPARPAVGWLLTLVAPALVLTLILSACGQGAEGPSKADSAGDAEGPSDDDAGEGTEGTEGTDLPDAITCGTQYRPDAEQMEGAESPTLTVERDDDLAGTSATHEFPTMTLTVTYVGDAPEGRTVRVSVTADDDTPLFESLYQIGTPLQDIEFAGGHGFTGLNYVHHGEAMLQVWCEAST